MTSCVWVIAGSDNSGEAGIQADLKTLQDFNVRACTIVTAITAQNRYAVQEIYYLPQQILQQQIHSLLEHSPAQILKKWAARTSSTWTSTPINLRAAR